MLELQIRPMELNSTGNYAPAERYRPAVIGIFMNVFMDEDAARRVLAHYVVHQRYLVSLRLIQKLRLWKIRPGVLYFQLNLPSLAAYQCHCQWKSE
jgi:hypothetical protein